MADEIENLMLEHLKRFQAVLDRVERKLDDLTRRVGKTSPHKEEICEYIVIFQSFPEQP